MATKPPTYLKIQMNPLRFSHLPNWVQGSLPKNQTIIQILATIPSGCPFRASQYARYARRHECFDRLRHMRQATIAFPRSMIHDKHTVCALDIFRNKLASWRPVLTGAAACLRNKTGGGAARSSNHPWWSFRKRLWRSQMSNFPQVMCFFFF